MSNLQIKLGHIAHEQSEEDSPDSAKGIHLGSLCHAIFTLPCFNPEFTSSQGKNTDHKKQLDISAEKTTMTNIKSSEQTNGVSKLLAIYREFLEVEVILGEITNY